jgi:hypothetical protein
MSLLRSLLAFFAITTAAWAAEIQLAGNGSHRGELLSLNDRQLAWRDENGHTVVEPLHALLGIDLQPAAALPSGLKYTEVALTDGSLLHVSRFALKRKEVELTLAVSGQVARIPLTAAAWILNDASDPAIRQEWQEKYLGKKQNQDFLALRRKDGSGLGGGLEGTLSGNEKGRIVFEFQGSSGRNARELDPVRVQGMIFLNSLGPQAPSSVCQVHDVNQNILVASRVTADAKSFTVTTVSGAVFEYPRAGIARLDYRSDKLVYLSNLKPLEVIEKTKQGRKDNWRIDKNLENSSLQLEGQVYAKGLSLHSHTEMLYALDGKYKEFKAIVGLDDMVGGDGRPLVKIEADGKELFADTVSRKDKRRELTLDVKGVKQLRIIVTSSGLFDFGDHIDFADARLCK